MEQLLTIMLLIVSVLIIVVVLLQSGKDSGLSGTITGGAEQLFGKQKTRGIDKVLNRVTVVLAILFFGIGISIAYVM